MQLRYGVTYSEWDIHTDTAEAAFLMKNNSAFTNSCMKTSVQ